MIDLCIFLRCNISFTSSQRIFNSCLLRLILPIVLFADHAWKQVVAFFYMYLPLKLWIAASFVYTLEVLLEEAPSYWNYFHWKYTVIKLSQHLKSVSWGKYSRWWMWSLAFCTCSAVMTWNVLMNIPSIKSFPTIFNILTERQTVLYESRKCLLCHSTTRTQHTSRFWKTGKQRVKSHSPAA